MNIQYTLRYGKFVIVTGLSGIEKSFLSFQRAHLAFPAKSVPSGERICKRRQQDQLQELATDGSPDSVEVTEEKSVRC